MNKETILVTGGSGLVGTAISGSEYIKLSSRKANLENLPEVDKAFRHFRPDHVIHAAGKVGGVLSNMTYKANYLVSNLKMNINVLETAKKFRVNRLVAFLSTCVFPVNADYPLSEDQIHLGPPAESNDSYAYAKRMMDMQIKAYRKQYGLHWVSVIPTNIYGINDNFSLEHGHVIPSLIHKCYLAKKHKMPFIIWGSGEPLREFLYSKDVALLTKWALKNYDEDEPIIFSTGEEVSIRFVAEKIAKLMQFDGEIIFDRDKPDGQFRKPTSIKKLRSYLPHFRFTPLEVGLKETINWFEENYPKVRR